jgi:ketosteroid isomerase-like protein
MVPEPQSRPSAVPGRPGADETLTSTLDGYCKSLADGDVETVLDFYRDDAIIVDLIHHRVFSSLEERRQHFEEWADGYEFLELTQREVLPAGDHVALKWTLRGSTTDGEAVYLRGVDIMVVDRRGRIRGQWGTFHQVAGEDAG